MVKAPKSDKLCKIILQVPMKMRDFYNGSVYRNSTGKVPILRTQRFPTGKDPLQEHLDGDKSSSRR